MQEVWKNIEGYEGHYQISNIGRVKSFKRNSVKILKPFESRGYYKIRLVKDGVKKYFRISRLVAFAFVDNPLKKPYVNHINGIKKDNSYINLEWCTQLENVRHSIETGLRKSRYGEESNNSKLKKEQVLEIRKMYKEKNMTVKQMSVMYKVTIHCIYDIINRKSWKHI